VVRRGRVAGALRVVGIALGGSSGEALGDVVERLAREQTSGVKAVEYINVKGRRFASTTWIEFVNL